MTDLLEQSAAWLDGRRHSFLMLTVVYQSGQASAQMQATAD